MTCDDVQDDRKLEGKIMKKLGIYVHVPFCRKKCGYCDFYSVKWSEDIENKYIKSIIKEIKSYRGILDQKYIVDTIYFGGGTPSILEPNNIRKIIDVINDEFKVDKNSEISMEANPKTFTPHNLSLYKKIGINRLSIGIQSLNDEILIDIGRLHNSQEALDSIKLSRDYGFENINADVMFNIPNQSVKDIEDTLNKIIDAGVKHISFYSLKLEEGTPMYLLEENKKIFMPHEDEERNMYYAGRITMGKNNLMQYEISNFAVSGYECKHNLKYWEQEEYIGFGPSAHSFLHNKRYSNPSDILSFCNDADNSNFNRTIQEVLSYDDLMFEYIMLNLRLTKGMDINVFNERFALDFKLKYEKQIEYLMNNNLVELDDENIRLTNRGMDVSNYVFQQFMQ